MAGDADSVGDQIYELKSNSNGQSSDQDSRTKLNSNIQSSG